MVLKTIETPAAAFEGTRKLEYRLVADPQGIKMLAFELNKLIERLDHEKPIVHGISFVSKDGAFVQFRILVGPDVEQ